MLVGLPIWGQALCGDFDGAFYFFNEFPGENLPFGKCNGFRCAKPLDGGPFIRLSDLLCDPVAGACAVEIGRPRVERWQTTSSCGFLDSGRMVCGLGLRQGRRSSTTFIAGTNRL